MCTDMRPMCTDMCVDMCMAHVHRHACRHVYGRCVQTCVWPMCTDMRVDMCMAHVYRYASDMCMAHVHRADVYRHASDMVPCTIALWGPYSVPQDDLKTHPRTPQKNIFGGMAQVRYRVIGEPRPTEVSLGGLDWSQQLGGRKHKCCSNRHMWRHGV